MFKSLFVAAMQVRYPLVTYKTKASALKKVLCHKEFIKFSKYKKLLQHNLRIKSIDAGRMLFQHPQICYLSEEDLIAQCNLCLKLNIDTRRLLKDPYILLLPRKTLENKIMLLLDMGIPSDQPVMMPCTFASLMKMQMIIFKYYMKIPLDDIVANNILSVIKEPPKGVQPLEIPSDNLRLDDYHKHCLKWYVQWKLNIPEENVTEMNNILALLRTKSFSIMEQLFEIYCDEIGLTIEEIKEHQCLVHTSPSNLRLIIDEEEMFCGKEMKKLIKLKPKLCKMEYTNVVKVIKLLEKYDYSEATIQRHPEILLIGASELKYRFERIENTPELRVLKNNMFATDLLFTFKKGQQRLNYLHYLNVKFATVRILTANGNDFNRFLVTGVNHTRAKEIGQSFTKVFNIQPSQIVKKLRKHPHWNLIDLVSMHNTTNFLLKNKFKAEDIFDNLPIILYPSEKLAETLENIKKDLSPKDGSNGKKRWRTSKILALCLYRMEREFHFSGDGIWRQGSLIQRPAKPSIQMIEYSDNELSDCSDTENAENEEADRTS